MSAFRETGGNQFIAGDSDLDTLRIAIDLGLDRLARYAAITGRRIDLGELTIETKRIPTGAISVSVTGDLASTAPAPVAAPDEENDRG